MSRSMFTLTLLLAAMTTLPTITLAQNPGPPRVRFGMMHEARALDYEAERWSIRAEAGRGWLSLKLGESEFLASGQGHGGVVFRRGERFFTFFPDLSNLSHDQAVGRQGSVSDGIFMARVTPDAMGEGLELYAGFNADEPADLVLLLSDDVTLVRAGGERVRSWSLPVEVKPGAGVEVENPLLVHRRGESVLVQGRHRLMRVRDPGGVERLAVALACKGFAANSFRLALEPSPRSDNFAVRPMFDVRSSDDPAQNVLGPTSGVKNPIYTQDTRLDYGMKFEWRGDQPFNGVAELRVIHALGQEHVVQRVKLQAVKPDARGNIRVKFEPRFHLPGVSEAWCRLIGSDGRMIWVDRYRMGYELEKYRPRLVVEPDFQRFWQETLRELRSRPLEARTQRVERYADAPGFEVYEVSYNGLGGQRVWAMMFVPREGRRPMPAIITGHPGTRGFGINKSADGVYGSRLKHDPRFVTLVPLIRGHAPDAPDVPFNHPWWGPLEDRDSYVARAWYAAMVRGMDYLAERAELVDMGRVMASGGSQGGALAIVTAALDPRVAVCIADCPANAQPHEIMENYPSFGPSLGQVPPGRTADEVQRMLGYYNPVNFAPLIRVETHVGSNIGDLTVHSMGPLAIYHNLTGLRPEQKAFHPGFTHFHGSGPGLGAARQRWMDRLAGDEPTTTPPRP